MIDVTRHQSAAPSDSQRAEIAMIKRLRPHMIAYGALNPSTGEWFASCAPTLHRANKLAREGWQVWTA